MIGDYLVKINSRWVRLKGYVHKGLFIPSEDQSGTAGNLTYQAVAHKPLLDPGIVEAIRTKDPGKARRLEKKIADYKPVDIPALQAQARADAGGQDLELAPLSKLLRDRKQELWEACARGPEAEVLEVRLARGDLRMNEQELEYVTQRAATSVDQVAAEYMQHLHKVVVAAGGRQPQEGPRPIELIDFMRRWDNTVPMGSDGTISILMERFAFIRRLPNKRNATRLDNEAAMIDFIKDRATWTNQSFSTTYHMVNAGLGVVPRVADIEALKPEEVGVVPSVSYAQWVERFRRQMSERDPDTGEPVPYDASKDLMKILPHAVEVENWLRNPNKSQGPIGLLSADTGRLLLAATGNTPQYSIVADVLDPTKNVDPVFKDRVLKLAPHAQIWRIAEEDVEKCIAIAGRAAEKDFMTDWFDKRTDAHGNEERALELDGLELPDGRRLNMPGYRIVKPPKDDPRILIFSNYVASCMHIRGPMRALVSSLATSESAGVLYLMRDGIDEPISFLVGVQGRPNQHGEWGLGFGAWTSTDANASENRKDIMQALGLYAEQRDDAARAAQGLAPQLSHSTIGVDGYQNTARTFDEFQVAGSKVHINPRRNEEEVDDMRIQRVIRDRRAQLAALRGP